MCIAVAKPADKKIDVETLGRCFTKNPDGAGFAYSNGSDMVIVKGLMSFEEFKTKYEEHKMDSKQGLIHFRITTRGSSGPENTHPFPLRGGALIHNGTISSLGKSGEGKSDTALLAEMLHDQPIEALERMRPMIENFTTGSRVAAMYANGELVVFNASAWTREDGVLYSNTSFRAPTPVATSTNTHSTGRYNSYSNGDYYGRGARSYPGMADYDDEYVFESDTQMRRPAATVTHLTPSKKPIVAAGTHRDNAFFQLMYNEEEGFQAGYVAERRNGAVSKYVWLDVNALVGYASLVAAVSKSEKSNINRRRILMSAMTRARAVLSEMTRLELFQAAKAINDAKKSSPLAAAAASAQTAETAAAAGA